MVEPATSKKQISTELSSRQVTLSASQGTSIFEATVYNDSDRFASFQVKLLAAGVVADAGKPWYRLKPSVSSKIPAGDCTRFQIEIFDLPPIAHQFRGSVDLTVEVTSRELDNQSDRQALRLLAEGIQGQPPSLTLTVSPQANPGDRIAIVAQIHNSVASLLEATLQLYGLPEHWFPEGTQQTLTLPPDKLQKVTFTCEVPPPNQAPSQIYPLRVEAIGRFPKVVATGQCHLLPAGALIFDCDPLERSIPELLGRWRNPTQGIAEFTLQFNNQSNIEPEVQVTVTEVKPRRRWFWQKDSLPVEHPQPPVLPEGVMLGEVSPALPLGTTPRLLHIQKRLPWLGWTRLKRFEVIAQTMDSPIPLKNETQTLQVYLFPVIPLWQQLLGALLALGLGGLAWVLLTDPGHRGPVNSVQFNGQGTEVLSGSDDQTIRLWEMKNQSLRTHSHIGNLNKAVRVARYRPVNNDQIALGLENGEIQLANLLTGKRSRLTPDKDDRVFALQFSRDARTLYSGHGSGLVLQWDITNFLPEQTAPKRAYDTQFAIETMALIGDDDKHLAIAGRFNRLVLLDVGADKNSDKNPDKNPDKTQDKKQAQWLDVPYPSGGSTDYISSLAAAEQQPHLLAIADTQGRISLWDTRLCLRTRGKCEAIDQPWLGHGGSPVRAIALSGDGCFLASAGDDGQVKLWPLDGQGVRRSNAPEGRILARIGKPLNAVDIIQTRDGIWVVSGGEPGKVRLYQVNWQRENRSSDGCPALAGGGT